MNNASLYIVTVLIWGSTWLAIEFQLGVVPAEVSVFYRYALAAAILFAWCAVKRLRLRFSWRAHGQFALLGLLMFSINYLFAYHGQRYLDSALMAVAFSTLVWMNIINSRIFFGARTGRTVLIGAALGIIGMGLMFAPAIGEASLSDATLIGALMGVAGTYSASLGNMAAQKAQHMQLPIVQSNAWGMAYGAMINGIIALAAGSEFVYEPTLEYTASLIYLALFGSVIAFGAYLTLLGRIGASRAGYITILFPLVAILLSVLFEDLKLTPVMLSGMALVLIGNYLVMRRTAQAVKT